MSTVVITPAQAESIWDILVEELGAEPEWKGLVVDKLIAGELPLPLCARDEQGVRQIEVIEGGGDAPYEEAPRIAIGGVPGPAGNTPEGSAAWHRYHGQHWASFRLAALFGVTDEDYYGGHAFPVHANLKHHKTHCLQCGVTYEHWREGRYEGLPLKECPCPRTSAPLAGHTFPREDFTTWLSGECAGCELDYRAWVKDGCEPCALAPIARTPRGRPSALAGRVA